MTELVAAILGAMLGVGGTLAWEAYFKPRRERKSLALALASEVLDNVEILQQYRSPMPGKQMDWRLMRMSSTIFSAVASRLGELDPYVLAQTAAVYRRFQQIADLHAQYYQTIKERPYDPPPALSRLHDSFVSMAFQALEDAMRDAARPAIDLATLLRLSEGGNPHRPLPRGAVRGFFARHLGPTRAREAD